MPYEPTTEAGKIRVLVADSSRIHTQLLAEALKRDRSLEVISAEAGSSDLIATALARHINVLVISAHLEEQADRGLEVLREIRASRPEIRAVVLLDSSKPEVILDAFRAGARGVLSRHESVETLCKCVRSVHDGQIWATSHEMSLALDALASSPNVRAVGANGLSLLSKRELDVVQSLAEGLTNREIAERLGLSQHTIKNYLFRVFDKLGVSSRVELLFMTLSQSGAAQAASQCSVKNSSNGRKLEDPTFASHQKATGSLPAVQLALAQMDWAGAANPGNNQKDIGQAYTWYLIAHEQIARARKDAGKRMTSQQVFEAEQRAAEWLSTGRKTPSSAAEPAADSRPLARAFASAD